MYPIRSCVFLLLPRNNKSSTNSVKHHLDFVKSKKGQRKTKSRRGPTSHWHNQKSSTICG